MTDTVVPSGASEAVKSWGPKGKPKKLKKLAKKRAVNPIPGKPGRYYDDASDRVVPAPRKP